MPTSAPVSPPLADAAHYGPQLADAEFEFIRLVVGENAGIVLGPNKRQLVQGRLARRLRELGLPTYEAYCNYLREAGPEELVGLINAITTNVTSFFRENHHFEALASYMLPEAMKRNAASRRLRIWSAGCSTGEEPHCIAMVAAEVLRSASATAMKWDFKILATDIDSDVVAAGSSGVYPLDRMSSVSPERLKRFFQKGSGEHEGAAIAKPDVRAMITFRTLNLLHTWPMKGPFDVIFCRNVMIYFDQQTQAKILARFAPLLRPDGLLFAGHSENFSYISTDFKLLGQTVYTRA